MSAPEPERDTRAETLGRIAYETMHASREERDRNGDHIPWEQLDELLDFGALKREDMEAAAAAVAAHVVDPTPEITRLRELLARVRADLGWIWRETTDDRAGERADQALTALKEAGIE